MTLAQNAAGTAMPLTVDDLASVDGVTAVDTTEMRWFAEGPMPAAMDEWFTRSGTVGAVEERCDSYRMDDQSALGVKRRFRTTLEMKMRQSVGEHLILDDDLAGRLEVWRKWSPIGGFAESSAPWPWLDVEKRVVKRRFSVGGNEIAHSANADTMDTAGCDVEIVSVRAGDASVWSFAFAAFGPQSTRRDALLASWDSIRADDAFPDGFGSLFSHSCGYPEWLAALAARMAPDLTQLPPR